MSQPDSSSVEPRGVLVKKKPLFDVYAWMLILAFVALCVGTLFLYLEKKRYEDGAAVSQAAVSPVVWTSVHTLRNIG